MHILNINYNPNCGDGSEEDIIPPFLFFVIILVTVANAPLLLEFFRAVLTSGQPMSTSAFLESMLQMGHT